MERSQHEAAIFRRRSQHFVAFRWASPTIFFIHQIIRLKEAKMKLFAMLALVSMIAAPAFAQDHAADESAEATATAPAATETTTTETTKTETKAKKAKKHGKHMKHMKKEKAEKTMETSGDM
jgi:hypothetical protein